MVDEERLSFSTIERMLDVMGYSHIQVNDDISYPPSVIEIWAKKVIKDRNSNEDLRCMVADMLFKYFMNTMNPLNPNNQYFIKRKYDCVYLLRDNTEGGGSNSHDYVIRTEVDGVRHISKKRMTEREEKLLSDILTDHGIFHSITDMNDILSKHSL
jgi:uncharacterized C2H2 Zn-finger protein